MYQLIDFGDGRRLEQFGPLRLDRPCPAADGAVRQDPHAWDSADARFDRRGENTGRWTLRRELPDRWTVSHDRLVFELKRTEFGHLGLFPEQVDNWAWIAEQVRAAGRPLKVLNLFAYTGGSTLAAAAAGAEVVHVDAARNVVAWARRNAELSGLAESPIRWIAEDATKFVRRELKRGEHYDAVILDPPSYGHGARGEAWRLAKHLPQLLEQCGQLIAGRSQLTAAQQQYILLTCHTPEFGPARLKAMLADALENMDSKNTFAAPMTIRAATGRQLPSGVVVRWERTS